jgi:hypothetical protein
VIAETEIAAIMRHLRVVWRAESLIIDMRLRAILRRTGFFAFAGLIAVFGLAMLNVAAYFALAPIWGDALAMLVVAVADFIIAGILIAIGSRETTGIELTLAEELRDQAIEAIEIEARNLAEEVSGAVRRPAEIAGSVGAFLISLILGFLRGRKR